MLESSSPQHLPPLLRSVHKIPEELRVRPQWCLMGQDAEPINPRTGNRAAVDNPGTWGSFDDCLRIATRTGSGLGFVLSENDPYCIVDLDDKESNPASQEDRGLFGRLMEHFDGTYQEVSKSGRGYHIIVKAKLDCGRRTPHVEVYDSRRFFVLTGHCNAKPILEMQSQIESVVASMPNTRRAVATLPQSETELLSDREVVELMLAHNGPKAEMLTAGPDLWKANYPSQSEADYALLSILWFYSRAVGQTIRIFRLSPLGQREKAHRDEYLLSAIERIRANEPPLVEITLQPPALPTPAPKPKKHKFRKAPGFVGKLADEFYLWSKRPVVEIATAAALGVVSGIVARSYNYSGTGLNQYLFLLAETGRGKEAIHDCINRMFNEMSQTIPGVMDFMGPSEFASPQAVIKTLSRKPVCISLVGEFGHELEQMSNPKNVQKAGVRKVLLNVYNKSGKRNMLHGSAYADAEKNIASIHSPALSIIGECTFESYYKGVDVSHIAEGLLPRFLTISYHGKRVPLVEDTKTSCDPAILRQMSDIAIAALSLQQSNQTVNVQETSETKDFLRAYNAKCDAEINNAQNDVAKELWNRAHFKAFRVAAVLAVADNPHNPIITKEHAEWAEWLVSEDINMNLEKFESGDIGTGDSKQMADLRRAVGQYLGMSKEELLTAYAIPGDLIEKRLVPYVYLQRRTSGLSSFKGDRLGATAALKRAVEELVATGEIQELPRSQGHMLGYTGRLFYVTPSGK